MIACKSTKNPSYTLSMICESALKGSFDDQEYLERLLHERWADIRDKLEINGDIWNKWWSAAVHVFEKKDCEY